MMASMDAEAEMEGLFAGDDQSQGQDEEATQTLTQEEREAGGANLDVTGTGDAAVKKKVVRRPQAKLDDVRLMGPRGINTLDTLFADFKPQGKGREFEDLDLVMKRMEHWAHRLFPKLPFDSVLEIIANRLGKKKVVQTHVKKIRLGMAVTPVADADKMAAAEAEAEEDVERYDGGTQAGPAEDTPDLFESLLGQVGQTVAPPVPRPAALTEEQQARIKRNKELAALKRREREQREAEEKRREEEEGEMEEIEREMLTSQNASEWSKEAKNTQSEVEASCLKTVEELHEKKKKKQIIESDSEDEAVGEVDKSKSQEDVESENSNVKETEEALIDKKVSVRSSGENENLVEGSRPNNLSGEDIEMEANNEAAETVINKANNEEEMSLEQMMQEMEDMDDMEEMEEN